MKIYSNTNQEIGAEVYIDDLPAPGGIYLCEFAIYSGYKYNYKQEVKLRVENGIVRELYYIERIKKLVIEKTSVNAQKGDRVFLITGEPAPTGRYSLGLFDSDFIVEAGKFVKYT